MTKMVPFPLFFRDLYIGNGFFRDLYIGTGFLEPKSPPSRLPARMDLKKQLICPYNRTPDADPIKGPNIKKVWYLPV